MNLFVTVSFSVKQCNAQELDRTSNARKICRPIRAIPDIAAKKNESIHLKHCQKGWIASGKGII